LQALVAAPPRVQHRAEIVSGQLLSHGDGGGVARCTSCGELAVGPCARCRKPVCGDCCVLTTGGAGQWAICLGCDRSQGRSLGASWASLLGFILKPLLVLVLASVLLYLLTGR
jgi:hypothetical protein